jgi:hypothetical protein
MNKIDDYDFLQELQEYDVVILSETHLGYSDNLHIDGYSYFPVCRNVSSNGRYYGGLGIFRKISIRDHIKTLPSTLKDPIRTMQKMKKLSTNI